MRISDWSSDVCSSDLLPWPNAADDATSRRPEPDRAAMEKPLGTGSPRKTASPLRDARRWRHQSVFPRPDGTGQSAFKLDRKSVVSGTRVSLRVDLGGRRILKKQQT